MNESIATMNSMQIKLVQDFDGTSSKMIYLRRKMNIRSNTWVFIGCFVFMFLFNMMTSIPNNSELNYRAFQSSPKQCKVNGGLAIAHDADPMFEAKLNGVIKDFKQTFDNYDMPEISVVSSSFYFHTTDPRQTVQRGYPSLSRAWNESFAITDHESITNAKSDIWGSQGFEDKIIQDAIRSGSMRELEDGKYTVFSGWFVGNFGHFVHDFASKIAWLKTLLPEDTKFLIPHDDIYQNVLNAIDKEFVQDRVRWVTYGETVHVKNGSLTVMKPKSQIPFLGG